MEFQNPHLKQHNEAAVMHPLLEAFLTGAQIISLSTWMGDAMDERFLSLAWVTLELVD